MSLQFIDLSGDESGTPGPGHCALFKIQAREAREELEEEESPDVQEEEKGN